MVGKCVVLTAGKEFPGAKAVRQRVEGVATVLYGACAWRESAWRPCVHGGQVEANGRHGVQGWLLLSLAYLGS